MFFSSVIFFFILIHLVAPIISALPDVVKERSSRLRLDSFHDRESRFEDLYISITDMKENDLDKRIAAAARLDPFLFVQFLLSTYVLINHIIEISIHLFEIWLKIVTPKELSDQTGLFCDNKVVSEIRNDVMKIVGKREGQQVAYSILCLLNASPNGCVLPLIIRDLSLLFKSVGLILLLCFPEIGKSMIYSRTYSKGSNKNINISETSKQNTDQMENHQFENEMKIDNSGFLIDVICDGISLIMETYILTYALTSLPKDKLNFFVLLKHIILGGLTFQYIGVVRGRSYGELLSSTLGTKTLESIQINFAKLNDVMSQLSLEHFITLFNGQKLQYFGDSIDEIAAKNDTNHSIKISKKNNATQALVSNKKGRKKKKKPSI
jgi:hypothetical protein